MNIPRTWLATATCLALPLAAVAQANPADPGNPAPALRYESAFADYRPWQDSQPGDWRAINDALGSAAAGHGSHAAAPAAPAAATQPAAPASPAERPRAPAADHGDHHMHGGGR